MKKIITKNQRGVSLIEMLVAVSLFSITMLIATSIFQMVIKGQAVAVASQNIQSNMRYALETMAKEIRMAKTSNGDCDDDLSITAVKKVYNKNGGEDELYFLNEDDECVKYYLADNRLKITRDLEDFAVLPVDGFVTPSDIEVSDLKFTVYDDDILDLIRTVQPRITMTMTVKATGAGTEQTVKIQTTITSRSYY